MRKYFLLFWVVAAFALCVSSAESKVLWENNSPMTVFLAEHYKVDPVVVVSLGQRMKKYDDDVSTALYLAKRADKDPMKMLDPRLEGKTWRNIMKDNNIAPETLFIASPPVKKVSPRFKATYSQMMSKKANPKYDVALSDNQIRDLVQLRLVKEAFNVQPQDAMTYLLKGLSFTDLINNKLAASR